MAKSFPGSAPREVERREKKAMRGMTLDVDVLFGQVAAFGHFNYRLNNMFLVCFVSFVCFF